MSQKRVAWSSQFCAKDFSGERRHGPPYTVTQHLIADPQSASIARLAFTKSDADPFDLG
jgi:hypothetical protein